MDHLQESLSRLANLFWLRFGRAIGWEPDVDQRYVITVAALALAFALLLVVYVRRILKRSRKRVARHRRMANYQRLRRYQNAHDR